MDAFFDAAYFPVFCFPDAFSSEIIWNKNLVDFTFFVPVAFVFLILTPFAQTILTLDGT